MKVFTYSEARQNLSKLLLLAQKKDGAIFSLVSKKEKKHSPFDVPGIKTQATTQDILEAIRISREG